MEIRSRDRLIRCTQCDAVFLETAFDRFPEYVPSQEGSEGSYSIVEKDDSKEFYLRHRGHRKEILTIIPDTTISDKRYGEPVRTCYFRATNGKENFLIRKWRDRPDEPMRVELIRGDYFLECSGIYIQTKQIKLQLARKLSKTYIPPEKTDAFVSAFKRTIETCDLSNLEMVEEISSHPLEVYFRMDDVTRMYLLRKCHSIFKGKEYEQIEEFIDSEKDDGVLLVKATYEIKIVKQAESKKTKASPVSALLSVKERMIKEIK